jgi:polar amino acid transport system permease protein
MSLHGASQVDKRPDLAHAAIEIPGIGIGRRLSEFPYWFVALVAVLLYLGYLTFFDPTYAGAKRAILDGIPVTIRSTLIAFGLAVVLGLLAGLARVSRRIVLRNLATLYVEFIRGVPMLVLIFVVALVIVPTLSDAVGIKNRISNEWRAIIALAIIYGGYLAEVFRAGIESVGSGQSEAGRSLGMTHTQTMRYVVLPQAVKNVLPALGNDFIAMLKDSSLLSVVAVREITHLSRLYANSSFEFREAFLAVTFLYLTGTMILSLLVQFYARRLERG